MWAFYVSVAALGLVISTYTLISRQELATEHVEIRTGLEKGREIEEPTAPTV